MTNHEAEQPNSLSDSNRPEPAWKWLKDRLPSEGAAQLGHWIHDDLERLECEFAHLVTEASRKREQRKQISSARNPSNEHGTIETE